MAALIPPGRSIWVRIGGRKALVAALALSAVGQPFAAELSDGVYTSSQAVAGANLYTRECAQCHAPALEGGESGPALRGRVFLARWLGRPVADFHKLLSTTMPLTNPGGLADAAYLDLAAFILNRNGFPAGASPLDQAGANLATFTQPISAAGMLPTQRVTAAPTMVEWLHHRGDPGAQNYSSLDQINADNVTNLQVVWRWKSDNFGPTPAANLEVTPLMADGVLYATAGARRAAVAIDATTGETLWMHRLDEGERGANAPRKGPGRGLAYWREGEDARVLYITPGYQLVALDARSGQLLADFGTQGIVDLKVALDPNIDPVATNLGSSSPPLIVGNVVIVGAAFAGGGAPPTKEMPVGSVTAYDVRSGKKLWSFDTVPRPGQVGNDSWHIDSWAYTGNTGVWAPMSADPELGYVYLPVEEATGDFYGGHRPGDNLFSQSLVCLDARTGKRVWHFQTIHHGIWDYDLPSPPVLIDIDKDGRSIPAVAQVTKQGFVFVFDRRTGVPLWPIEERAVPQSDVPGETTAPTQPFPTLPLPFTDQGVGPETLNNLTPEIHHEALRLIANARRGPLYTPPSLITPTNLGTLMAPAPSGGGNWQGGVADPELDILFVPSISTIGIAGLTRDPALSNMDYVYINQSLPRPFGLPLARPPWGRITAIDLRTGQHLWMVANGDTPEAVRNHPMLKGIDLPRTGHGDRAGLLVTASLLFAGEGAGLFVVNEGGTKFRAHEKLSGKILAEIDLGARQSGMPMTYAIGNRQYIVVAVGAPGQGGEFVALALPEGN